MILATTAATAAFLDAPARGDVVVNDYNWLQLRPGSVTPFVGGAAGGGSGYGEPADYRWGDHVWIPDGTLTADGTGQYFAALSFDAARPIETVIPQWWAHEGTSVRQFFVDASPDGTNWTQIGSHDYGSFQSNSARFRTPVDVTDGTYKNIRIRLEPGDYTFGNANRGGPGLYAIEPIGDGTVETGQLNWANNAVSGSTVSNNGFDFNGTRYNDGFLFDDEGQRTGQSADWEAGDYVQLDLQQPRAVDSAVVVWDHIYASTSFNVEYSMDGTTFQDVTGKSAAALYAPASGHGATGYTFDPVTARYFRITDAAGSGGGYNLLNQVLLYEAVPEPSAGLAAIGLVGALAMRRARRGS